MRYLCVCNGGNVRSVTLARILKDRGHEALNVGINKTYSHETLLLLFNWADRIFFQKDAFEKLKSRIYSTGWASEYRSTDFENKADFRFDVGPDDWKIPQHPDLLKRMRLAVDNLGVKGERVL